MAGEPGARGETEVQGAGIEIRRLERAELGRVAEIDRTERIGLIYEQRGRELVPRPGDWSAPPWDPAADGEHSVRAQRSALEQYVDRGGVALGAFASRRLVGIGVVLPHLQPGLAQLAFLHVSHGYRAQGIGGRLLDELERIVLEGGDTGIVVSATPSENTVRFYLRCGYGLMAEPLPELYALEPEDVHLLKSL